MEDESATAQQRPGMNTPRIIKRPVSLPAEDRLTREGIHPVLARILAARVMGASKWQVFRTVMFFESLPQTFVGLRMAVSLALVVIIVAEMFIGSTNGMGHRIIDAQQVFDLQQMYASILMTGMIGYGFNVLFLTVEKHAVHWAGR